MSHRPPKTPHAGSEPPVEHDSQATADTATVSLSNSDKAAPEERRMAHKIGRHVVLEEVGRGGMGSVYRAYDPKLQREVALKQLRAKSLGEEGRARFEQEARAMASLSHPNVVSVYDVEALDDGQLVLVMEYVDGPTLRAWSRQTSRPWQDVLTPFLDAGRGLWAAHKAGILHRDFKPANVLVTPEISKVTDFGLAKRAKDFSGASLSGSRDNWEDTGDDDLTRAGEVMGTPRYMAPEQHHGKDLSPAVDQFAFCVALWEALTQAPPYSGRKLARQKAKGPPEWPTACGPRWLGDALLRGLSPKPDDRWPSMDALLTALSRDPSRRRSQIIRGAVVVALMGAAGGATYAARSDSPSPCSGSELHLENEWGGATREAVRSGMTSVDVIYARALSVRVDKRLDRYAQAWIEGHRAACEATVRKQHSAALRDLRMGCLDRGRIAFGAIVDLLVRADVDVLRNVDTMLDELPEVARCGDIAALQEGTDPPSSDDAQAVNSIREALELAKVDRLGARFDDAQAKLERARNLLDRVDYVPARGEFQLERAKLLLARGNQTDAAAAFRIALRLAVESRDFDRMADAAATLIDTVGNRLEQPDDVLPLREIAEAAAKGNPQREAQVAMAIGLVLVEDGQFAAGERLLREALEVLTEALDSDDQRVAGAHNRLANVLRVRGKLPEAEAEYRIAADVLTSSLGADHPKIAIVRGNLATVLRMRGQLAEAETEARAADASRLRSLGPKHVLYGSGKTILSEILTDARRFEEAEAEAKQGLEIVQAAVGRIHGKSANAVNSLGRILIMRGKAQEAERAFRETLAIRTELNGADHPSLAGVNLNIAVALRRQNRLDEAEAIYREAERVWTKAYGPAHPNLANVHNNLGVLFLDQERYEESKAQSERAIEIKRSYLSPEDPAFLDTRGNLAEALTGLGEYDAAIALRRAIAEVLEPKLDSDSPRLAINRQRLASVLLLNDENDEALGLAEAALQDVRKSGLTPAERGRLTMTLCEATLATDSGPVGRAKARTLAEQALQMFVKAGLDGELEAQETRDWLAKHPR
ncbi:MAG: serine/threonine-protein kinase [Nannocystaceae bacterium]|nr:serine/threonine-protein kinase [Nannocystaceae bacterium]